MCYINFKINWGSRMDGRPVVVDGKNVYASVDVTDCPINEPHRLGDGWFSRKCHWARNTVRISVSCRGLIWGNCPFKCGTHSDNKMFPTDIKKATNEFVITARGYTDSKCIITVSSSTVAAIHRIPRARHETLNSGLKNFNVLYDIFTHDISKHWACFHAVAHITAIITDSTNNLFSI